MPAIQNDSMNFYKPDSQLKNVTLDITEITPIATLKHILAIIEKIKLALQEAHFDYRKKQIELTDKNVELQEAIGSKKELLAIEIEEIEMKIGNSKNYTSGAIRKLNYIEQLELGQILNWDDKKIALICCKDTYSKNSLIISPPDLDNISL